MSTDREDLAEELHEALYAHRTLANSPGDCVCACDRTWRPTADYRAHLADAIAGLLAARDRRVRAEALRSLAARAIAEDLRNMLAEAWDSGYDAGRNEAYADERGHDFVTENPFQSQESK